MKLFKKVAVIGVGLIGGSIAMAIKKQKLADIVVGTSRHKKNIALAKKSGAIDIGSRSLSVIKGADLVIFAVPVEAILKLAPQVAKIINPGCIITDVGSTKQEIVKSLNKIFSCFIGAHPMAGSEKRSIANASSKIFCGSTCIITPVKNTNRPALLKIKKLWLSLGAKVITMPPAVHDQALSFVSHLPHLAAFSLINSVPQAHFKLAASGLKDTTRIAASDSEIWSEIFLTNRKPLLFAVNLLEKNIQAFKKAIISGNKNLLQKLLKQAKNKRDSL